MDEQAKKKRWNGFILGAITSLPVVALSFLGNQLFRTPFIAFNFYDFLTRILPRFLVLVGIDRLLQGSQQVTTPNLGAIDQLIQPFISVLLIVVLGGFFGLILVNIGLKGNRSKRLYLFGLLGGSFLWIIFSLIKWYLGFSDINAFFSIISIGVIMLLWGGLLGWALQRTQFPEQEIPEMDLKRRRFLYYALSSVVAMIAAGLGFIFPKRNQPGTPAGEDTGEMPLFKSDTNAIPPSPRELGVDDTSGPAASPALEELESRLDPAPGTRPEITATRDFYNIDINTNPPILAADTWRLMVNGLVDQSKTYTLQDIKGFDTVSQFVTMSCISNSVGGSLISTSKWTGIRLVDLLEDVGLLPNAQELYIESADGFFESVAMEDMMDPKTLLVYEMNGKPLPYEHGYPLRIYIPNRFGMKQPKWIVRMEAIDEEGPGYWVERGWSAEAIARTTSVFDPVETESVSEGILSLGGIAWAGARGISKVEVQINQGSWERAKLRAPALSPLTWVQWRYDWPVEPGQHTARVRTYDGEGKLQSLEETGRRPDGSTGVDTITFDS